MWLMCSLKNKIKKFRKVYKENSNVPLNHGTILYFTLAFFKTSCWVGFTWYIQNQMTTQLYSSLIHGGKIEVLKKIIIGWGFSFFFKISLYCSEIYGSFSFFSVLILPGFQKRQQYKLILSSIVLLKSHGGTKS